MEGIHTHFLWIDWTVLFAYLALTTWIGHRLRGSQATMKDFFLAGRSLPWPAVTGSIVATEISAITFVGVPGMVFAAGGDFTYLQWGIGSIMARFIVGIWFVKVFYERGIFSPYDYMQSRLGAGARTLTTWLFFLGSILGQSVRLLVTALILWTVTGLPFEWCIAVIGVFAIIWTLMGGMTTVIWTDVIQFFVFIGGGLTALGVMIYQIDGGFAEILRSAGDAGKLRLLDLSTNPDVQFTLWVGLLAMPFQNLAAFGTDQLNAQRMFCCRSASDASKAIIASSISLLVTVLMLLVGAALFVYYIQHPPSALEAAQFAKDPDSVFPVWITTVLPPGLTGLILAGAFAAAISSLDSALAALAQTTLSLVHAKNGIENTDQQKLVRQSRVCVVLWGLALIAVAIGLQAVRGEINLLSLAFGMVTYTYGPMLGAFLLALSPIRRDIRGVLIGSALSILLVLWVRPDLYNILAAFQVLTPEQAAALRPKFNFAWLYPITCLITLACGILLGRKRSAES
ncbi:MAG: sodium/solute symporter [Verrucomicrobia bacterium]|nr:sodium/solute symporter [Verrucomicrobiota bacterium]